MLLAVSLHTTGCIFSSQYTALEESEIKFSELVESLNGTTTCCEFYSDLSYEPLNFGDRREIKITENTPARKFEVGKSRFQAFDLPKRSTPYKIRVRGYPMGIDLRKAYVFYPKFILLDSTFNLVRDIEPRLEWQIPTPVVRPRLMGAINVFPGESKLIVYSDPSRFGHSSGGFYGFSLGPAPEGKLLLTLDK